MEGRKWGLIAIDEHHKMTPLWCSDTLQFGVLPKKPGVYYYEDGRWKKASLQMIARWLQNG
jgi:hypothetical protein